MPLGAGQLPAGHRCDIVVRHCATGFRHNPRNPLGTKGFALVRSDQKGRHRCGGGATTQGVAFRVPENTRPGGSSSTPAVASEGHVQPDFARRRVRIPQQDQ
jgi:hypothetical protein